MLLNRTLGSTLLLSALCLGSARPPAPRPGAQPSPLNVSMVQLIANPKAFHGKWVRVIGFCHLEFEGNALYLHRDDYERAISRNGVWLNAPEGKEGLSNQYVLVEGVFEDATSTKLGSPASSPESSEWRRGRVVKRHRRSLRRSERRNKRAAQQRVAPDRARRSGPRFSPEASR